MGLIAVKNPSLYSDWIDYLCAVRGVAHSDAQIRVEAFCKSQSATPVPMHRY